MILGPQGPKVIDFGIARLLLATDPTLTRSAIGTPAYMAPEQIRGDDPDPASDVWALGATVAFAATGRGPFDAPTIEAILHNVLTRPPDLDDVPAPLAALLTPCLDRQPHERPTPEQLLAQAASPTPADASRAAAGVPHSALSNQTRPIPEPRPNGATVAYQPVGATRRETTLRTRTDDRSSDAARSAEDPRSPRLDSEQPAPWKSVPFLLTAILILQAALGVSVIVRDFAATTLVSNGLLANFDPGMAQVYLRQFHFGDGFLFALSCASNLLTAIALVRAVYRASRWRAWATATASILLAGFAVNAIDLPTRAVTHIVFAPDFDGDPKLTLDHATPWYTIIDTNITLLMLICSVLLIRAARRPST